MSEETSHSEEKESFSGKKYKQHYDKDEKKDGWSEDRETFLGKKYTQEYDEDGDKAGRNEIKETFWGDKYIQKYDNNGNKVGHKEKKEDFWGREYVQHYDQQGNKVGKSEQKETFFGNEYEEHKMKKQPTSKSTNNKSDDGLWGWIKTIIGLGIIVAGLYAIALAIVTLPLWGGIILISSIATFVFAEALKKETSWAISLYEDHKSNSIWFGPAVALGCAFLTFIIMLITGINFTGTDLVILAVFSIIAVWLSKRVALSIFRWRIKSLDKSGKAV